MSNPKPIVPTLENVMAHRYWLTEAGMAATDEWWNEQNSDPS